MAKKKVTFGSMATCTVRYAIVIINIDNTIRYVTKVQTVPHKYCEWNKGEQAYFFESRECAEDVCFGLNVNGTGAFVMEVPDYYDYENFKNN